jgi:methionyl-tRNA formyltransferase
MTADERETGPAPVRVVFFGTPVFAEPALRRLASDDRYEVTLVVTQPDRPAGRGRTVQASTVKRAATELAIPVFQPETLRGVAVRERLAAEGADLFVVAAFGLIFGKKLLELPRFGSVNLHASILPKYRGASPIPAAILARDAATGVTLMVMEPSLDTGPIIAVRTCAIEPDDTTESLTARLAEVAASLVGDDLMRFVRGEIVPQPQAPGATVTRPLVKADGWLDWSEPARQLEARVRAMWPWPRAYTTIGGTAGRPLVTLQVHRAAVADPLAGAAGQRPGTVVAMGRQVGVVTSDGVLELVTVQLPGGHPVPAESLLAGRKLAVGEVLGRFGAPEPPPPLIRLAPDTF